MSRQSEPEGLFVKDRMSQGRELNVRFHSENVGCGKAPFTHSCGGDDNL